MSRERDLDRFYAILDNLDSRTGRRLLADCDGRMLWPKQGLYFFFEDGEIRQSAKKPRVVRVGTHAVSANSQTTLWNRLSQHRGHLAGEIPGSGNHRGSIFRHHVGTALIKRHQLDCPSWEHKHASDVERAAEHEVEVDVSRTIGCMPLLWLCAEGAPGPLSVRKYLERNTIALLSNYQKQTIDSPTAGWLGIYCANPKVRASGLWNADHVDEDYDHGFLDVLAQLMEQMYRVE